MTLRRTPSNCLNDDDEDDRSNDGDQEIAPEPTAEDFSKPDAECIGEESPDIRPDDAGNDVENEAHIRLGQLLGNPAGEAADKKRAEETDPASQIHQIIHVQAPKVLTASDDKPR